MKYTTAEELRKLPRKFIQDETEALAMIRVAKQRFDFAAVFLDFQTHKMAMDTALFLLDLGYNVRFYVDMENVSSEPKTLEVNW